ncbi:MAG: tRNA-binding protein [Thermaerobacter sp.]|nr:tRNA-binding protein [Thermaerobacter sp.]
MATMEDFQKIDLRVGRIVAAEPFPEARKPAYRLRINFGALGERTSSAQLTRRYQPEDLVGRLCVAVVNFPARQIGPVRSEVLVLGGIPGEGDVVLLQPDAEVEPGTPIA